jgi:hypothetical protein
VRLPWIATTPVCQRNLEDLIPPTGRRPSAEWSDWITVLMLCYQLACALTFLHVSHPGDRARHTSLIDE